MFCHFAAWYGPFHLEMGEFCCYIYTQSYTYIAHAAHCIIGINAVLISTQKQKYAWKYVRLFCEELNSAEFLVWKICRCLWLSQSNFKPMVFNFCCLLFTSLVTNPPGFKTKYYPALLKFYNVSHMVRYRCTCCNSP